MNFRGVCVPVWGPTYEVAHKRISQAVRLNANWVQLVPHWYIATAVPYEGEPIFPTNNTVSMESLGAAIDLAHHLGLKVLLKPHIDWTQGGWRGHFWIRDDQARRDWESHYRNWMAEMAMLAEEHTVEALSIGCEFWDMNKDPAMEGVWLRTIADCRYFYGGMLTYASQWGWEHEAEYNRPGLRNVWHQLDFVGVDAYYSLSLFSEPVLSLPTLKERWNDAANPWWEQQRQNHMGELHSLHIRTNKQIVLTEIGYPNTQYAAVNPGGEPQGGWAVDEHYQANCARAVFDKFGKLDWCDGMFWWHAGPNDNSHRILYRPIGEVIQKRFQR